MVENLKAKAKAIVARWFGIKPEAEFMENMHDVLSELHSQIGSMVSNNRKFQRELEKSYSNLNYLFFASKLGKHHVLKNGKSSRQVNHLNLSRELNKTFFEEREGGAS